MGKKDVHLSPVTLHYLIEMDDTIQTGVLAKGVCFFQATSLFTLDGGKKTVKRGDIFQVVKHGGYFTAPKGRIPGENKVYTLPSRKIRVKRRFEWTVQDAIEYTVKPDVKDKNRALTYVLDPKHVYTGDKKNAYFLSVTHDVILSSLVESLKEFFAGQDPKTVYLWVDFFGINPFAKGKSIKDFQATLVDFVPQFKGQLVFFDHWSPGNESSSLSPLTDVKTVWEVFCARMGKIPTHALMTKSVRNAFLESLRTNGLEYFENQVQKIVLTDDPERLKNLKGLLQDAVDGDEDKAVDMAEMQYRVWIAHEYKEQAPQILKKHDILYGEVAEQINKIAITHSRNQEYDTAIELFKTAIDLERLGGGKKHPQLAYAKNNLALVYQKLNKIDEALQLLEEATEILEQCKQSNRIRERLMVMNANMSNIFEEMGDFEKAEHFAKKIISLRRIVNGKKHPAVAKDLNRLGNIQLKLKKVAEAKESLLAALSILEKTYDVDTEKERFESTIEKLATVYSLECSTCPSDHGHEVEIAKTLYGLTKAYEDVDTSEQQKYGERALSIMTETLGEDHPQTRKYKTELSVIMDDVPQEDD